MQVTIELRAGPCHDDAVTQRDIQKNIDALRRAVDGKPQAQDSTLLLDTLSIMEGIKAKLPRAPY